MRTGVAAIVAVSIWAGVAHAQSKSPAPAPPPARAPASAPAPASASAQQPSKQSAIAHVLSEIIDGLGAGAKDAFVVVSPLASDIPAPKGDDLAARIAAQIAGHIPGARAHPQPGSLGVARASSGRAPSLVFVQLEIAKGQLRLTADLYPVVSNGWDRLRQPPPGPRAHVYATAALDAEVRSFLAPVLLAQAQVQKAKHEETDVLAVGCGDVDADGGMELVIVSRARVVLGRIRNGGFVATRTKPWSAIAPRTPVPMREPLATVLVSPRGHRGEILLGSTDRGAIAVDETLVLRRGLTGLPIPGADGDACVVPNAEAGAFEGSGVACAPPKKGDPEAVLPLPATRFDAVASLDCVGPTGRISEIVASREAPSRLKVRRSGDGAKPATITLDNVGAQVAIGDLDLDGVPEIITSLDTADDAIVVGSWAGAETTQRLKLPAKEGVRALAVCPPEERGVPALVAVVGTEVWLVR